MHVRQVDVEKNKAGALGLNGADRCFAGAGLGNEETRLKWIPRLKVAKWFAVVHHQDASYTVRSRGHLTGKSTTCFKSMS